MNRWLVCLFLFLSPLSAAAQDAVVFEVDSLNVGLPATDADIDLSTPQSAIETFLFAAEDQDFATAAQVLNLNDIPLAERATRGPDLAEKLSTVIDRKVLISWQSLLERPDSLDANAPSDNAMAGQARKSLLLGVLDLDDRRVALRLNRLQPTGGEPVWVFSRQSVDVIEPLFVRYGPSRFEKMLPAALQTETGLGLLWWEIIALPFMVILAAIAAHLTWRILTIISRRQVGQFLSTIIKSSRLPATLTVIAAVILIMSTQVFVVSGVISSILNPLVVLTLVIAFMVFIINVIDAVLSRIVDADVENLSSPEHADSRSLATSISALRRIVVIVAVLAGTGITLTQAEIFQTLGFSLLAGAGALTLVLGFAAREVLGNILASLQISFNRSARVGDQLIYDDKLCTVERIHFTYVQLKVWDQSRMIVPVLKFVSDEFINRSAVDPDMIRHCVLKLSHTIDIAAIRKTFENWAAQDKRIGDDTTPECKVIAHNEFGVDVRFAVHVPDPRNGWDVECEMREVLLAHLREEEAKRDVELVPHLGTDRRNSDDTASAAVEAA
ncbi:Mechanosensitive ion channel [Cognatiyoonia koreensis]|uniref:Mechanosensitive ion channel n=1 Tax=Cognatiyoonia koreensis TaxID=364200 RepID=A0A1I0PQ68_9RHOB|nr:mechanosensitive ion channel family protein [Cognatiyoonia koreensis]SEW16546.1 Mechanosensitive ion channel [Cognatiyoonia koreensis]